MKTTMKKILSLLLLITVGMSSFAVGASQPASSDEFPDEMIILNELGIIELTNPGYILTKGDLAGIMAKLVYPDVNAKYSGIYRDINDGLSAAKAIQVLSDMGCIVKASNYFNPLIKATGNDVAEIFAGGILGYNAVTEDVWSAAVDAGIFKKSSISKNSYITMAEIAAFIYENLDTPSLVGFDGNYSKNENFTVLKNLGLKYVEGTLIRSPEGGVYGDEPSENHITIETSDGNITLKSGAADVSGYLGASGEFYYSDKSKGTLIYASFDEVNFLTVNGNSIVNVTNSKIYYEDEDGDRDDISYEDAVIVYNGSAVSSDNATIYVQPKHGYITVLKQGKNVVALYTWDYEVGVIASVDAIEQKIIFEKSVYETPTLVADRYDDIEVTVNGKKTDFSSLTKGQVCWYTTDATGENVSIFASNDNSFWAKFESKDSNFITLSGVNYEYADELFDSGLHGELHLGETGIFCKSPSGEIFAYVPDKIIEQNMYGYLLKATKPSGIDSSITLRLINELGQIKEYKLAQKIKFSDGNAENKYDTISVEQISKTLLFENGKLNDQLVKFSLNSNGEIRKISLAQDITQPNHPDHKKGFSDGNFIKVLANDTANEYFMRYDSNGTGKFDNKYVARSDCKVFYIKDDLTEAEVTTCANSLTKAFRDNVKTTGVELSLYNADRGLEIEMVVYKYSQKALAVNTAAFVVDKVTNGLDANRDEHTYLCGYSGDTYVKYIIGDGVDASSFECGELVQLGVSDNKIYSANSLVKPQATPFYYSKYNSGVENYDASANYHASVLSFKGKLFNVNDSRDRIVVSTENSWDTCRAFALSGANAYIYDSERNKVYPVALTDLPAVSYDDGAEIGFFAQNSIVKSIVIYR